MGRKCRNVLGDAPGCCFAMPSSVKQAEMRSGGQGQGQSQASQEALPVSHVPQTLSHTKLFMALERVCVCAWGRAPS